MLVVVQCSRIERISSGGVFSFFAERRVARESIVVVLPTPSRPSMTINLPRILLLLLLLMVDYRSIGRIKICLYIHLFKHNTLNRKVFVSPFFYVFPFVHIWYSRIFYFVFPYLFPSYFSHIFFFSIFCCSHHHLPPQQRKQVEEDKKMVTICSS